MSKLQQPGWSTGHSLRAEGESWKCCSHVCTERSKGPEAMGASSRAGPQRILLSKAFQALNEYFASRPKKHTFFVLRQDLLQPRMALCH